ncbi:MAG: hypothetical protein DA408_07155 [Bacteroidetes bacterium]|nr:MAG: hypothetical protein C7N36_08695 [Bacteroidota bacterium]PTM13374.1 MAG: hypothetical protein DA408_07155 [Bacteroidota bacterium]
MKTSFFLMSLFLLNTVSAQTHVNYPHQQVRVSDHSQKPTGFWLFEPTAPVPDAAKVIVLLHGYGGYNPMIYGSWIKHLVLQGNTVIFPRYQRNMVFPRPSRFVKNTAKGIQQALQLLATEGHVPPLRGAEPIHYIGHSYGGVIASNLAVHSDQWSLPKPAGIFLIAPGSGPFKGAVLEDYDSLSDSLKMLIVTHQNDWVVGSMLGERIFNESSPLMDKYLFDHRAFSSGGDTIWAHHNEAYALDLEFDAGIRNYTARRALQIGRTDAVNYNFLWPLFDRLMRATEKEETVFSDLRQKNGKFYFPFVLKKDSPVQWIEVRRPFN